MSENTNGQNKRKSSSFYGGNRFNAYKKSAEPREPIIALEIPQTSTSTAPRNANDESENSDRSNSMRLQPSTFGIVTTSGPYTGWKLYFPFEGDFFFLL